MAYNMEDKKDILYMKNQLINGDLDSLKKLYSSKEEYGLFIDTLNIALDDDPYFFTLHDFILEKAMEVVYAQRFTYKEKDYVAVINEIIERVNKIKGMSSEEKKQYQRQYVKYQQALRETSFLNLEDFLGALAYDAIFINKMEREDLSNTDPIYFFGSANYISKTSPEFFWQDNRQNIILDKLEEHLSKKGLKHWPERSFAKMVKKNIQKIKI